MLTIPLAVRWHGVDNPPTTLIPLRAGPLTALFDPELAFLRCIQLGRREVLRGIYSAVRDEYWGTVSPKVTNLNICRHDDGFDVQFDVECREGSIDFGWRGAISGSPDGSIHYSMQGSARSSFLRNRIGFCVLHPIAECAGHECQVETADGELVRGRFPKLISPHQPFKNMRAITHEVVPGVRVEVRMTGDVFEMEDQRNWSDASFKTYCTPLALPSPIAISAGTAVTQEICVALLGAPDGRPVSPLVSGDIVIEVGERPTAALPEIGLSMSTRAQPLSSHETARLRSLNLKHLRVDLTLDGDGWRDDLASAAREAQAIGAGLEAALFLGSAPSDQLQAVAREVDALRAPIARWLVFHIDESVTSAQWLDLARQNLPTYGGRVPIGAGTPGNFPELNRNRPEGRMPDLICYSTNPQVHAFDDRSLVETLPMHLPLAETARSFSGSLPIAVTPLTLRPSPNPANPARGEGGISGGRLPPSVDPRQMSLFAASWTVGALKYLAEAGIHSVTCFETIGWRGVMEGQGGSPAPELCRSIPGAAFPVYHVLSEVGEWADAQVLRTVSSDPLRTECLALERRGLRRYLVANLSPERQTIVIQGCAGPHRMRALDETTAWLAKVSAGGSRLANETPVEAVYGEIRLTLLPFAVARIDSHAPER